MLLPNPFYRDLNTNCQVEIKQNENLDTNRLIKVNDEADKSKSSTEKNMINENTCATSEETNKNQPLNNQDTDKETEDTPLHSHSIPNESKKDKKKTKKNNKKKKNQSLIPEEDVEERKSSKIREDPEDSNYEPLQENTVEEEEMSKPKKKTKGKGKSKKGKKK